LADPTGYRILSRDEHLLLPGPKRILALDGGGVRGILTLGFLKEIERILWERHGKDPNFRLCDYFDLIAGTSTGSIIAASLAQGKTVSEVIKLYQKLARQVFSRTMFRQGVLRARYDEKALAEALRTELDPECLLGDRRIQTGLLVVSKRLDTGSPWPLGNNPRSRYFEAKEGDGWISNGDYPLWRVVRASTAAPTFFDPEVIEIAAQASKTPVKGTFVDGGVSPHNNPALQAFFYATLSGYGLDWASGADTLLIVSVGTGRTPVERSDPRFSAEAGIVALQSLMDDCGALVETILQGLSASPTARRIDGELGDLSRDQIAGKPLISYLRYDVKLFRDPNPRDGIHDDSLLSGIPEERLAAMRCMDDPDPVDELLSLGVRAGRARIRPDHFPAGFDLPSRESSSTGAPASIQDSTRTRYVKRANQSVVAVALDLDTDGFRYRKWGDEQTCKAGDWIVNDHGSVHTVDRESFALTYRPTGPGTYLKVAPVWAEKVSRAGSVPTKEGVTHYLAGDYLVSNLEDGSDAYAVTAEKFEAMYEPMP
jgi:predicted acylesterase/phospholipase RssA